MDRLGLAEAEIMSPVTMPTMACIGRSMPSSCAPATCLGDYFRECHPLVPVWHHAKGNLLPAWKGVPVRVLSRNTGVAA